MHAKKLLQSIRIQSLVLTDQAVFLLERRQTDRQTDRQTNATECYTHASGYTADTGNN